MMMEQAETIALQALAAVVAEQSLRERFLGLTGFTGDQLREAAGDRETLLALLEFLVNHEPDLLVISATMDERPENIVQAHISLSTY